MSSALSAAQARQLITINVAALADLSSGQAPKALVWTDARVERCRATGERQSPVMVWPPEQTRVFLDRASRHELAAVFWLLAFTRLRRGEAVGLGWDDIDLAAAFLAVSGRWCRSAGRPRPPRGANRPCGTSALPRLWSASWSSTGHGRTPPGPRQTTGGSIRIWCSLGQTGPASTPDVVSRQLKQLVRESGLPPIQLHGLRRGAASIALAGGVDLKAVSEMLGHSSTKVTADIYTSVFFSLKLLAADAIGNALTRPDALEPVAKAA
ncbi:site-specific integrase [Catenulispora pinisilvae]|uniref:site-specific integrase n=1 Tax=Catenulispora pinisilvae TaxID=2705253 RepID=UPI001892386A|nr:site-specific integrase [Catenulispora pinisilvae]